jgi:hypothetical protein
MNCNDFSYVAYGDLLDSLLETRTNLCFRDTLKGNMESSCVLLRHDVDYSPESALRMAEFEAQKGVQSTYFLLFSSQYYNLFEVEQSRFPEQLVALGHEVGLHYDVQSLEKLKRPRQNEHEELQVQVDILASLAGKDVRSISMHNPSISGADPYACIDLINAYDPKFTDEIAYFSDSCGAWRNDFVECIERNSFPKQLQLLIHPIFWNQESRTRWATLERFHLKTVERFNRYQLETRLLWNDHSGVKQHDRRNSV